MLVTDRMGATTRTVLETTRTLLIWLVNLLLFYGQPVKGARLGEPWTAHSWLQAVGFAVLVAGTLTYGAHSNLCHRTSLLVCMCAAPSLVVYNLQTIGFAARAAYLSRPCHRCMTSHMQATARRCMLAACAQSCGGRGFARRLPSLCRHMRQLAPCCRHALPAQPPFAPRLFSGPRWVWWAAVP